MGGGGGSRASLAIVCGSGTAGRQLLERVGPLGYGVAGALGGLGGLAAMGFGVLAALGVVAFEEWNPLSWTG